jgi:dipeptide/tripeptide permease
MIKEYQSKTNIGIGLGLVLMIAVPLALIYAGGQPVSSGMLVLIVVSRVAGTILFIWGCCMYAKAKGYSAALGLLGLLFLIGLIILAVLPDKTKNVVVRGFEVQIPPSAPPVIPRSDMPPQ